VRNFVRDHVDPGAFAPDAVRILIAAFDGAWQPINANGARLSGQQSELTRELLAKYIIEQARQGELSARRRPASLGSVKSETSAEQFAPVTDTNFLEYPVLMDIEMLKRHLAQAEETYCDGR
jgi:hypothetical protein